MKILARLSVHVGKRRHHVKDDVQESEAIELTGPDDLPPDVRFLKHSPVPLAPPLDAQLAIALPSLLRHLIKYPAATPLVT